MMYRLTSPSDSFAKAFGDWRVASRDEDRPTRQLLTTPFKRAETCSSPCRSLSSLACPKPTNHCRCPVLSMSRQHRIVQALDWHFVSKDRFTPDNPDGDYAVTLDEVDAIQQQQMTLMRTMKSRGWRFSSESSGCPRR